MPTSSMNPPINQVYSEAQVLAINIFFIFFFFLPPNNLTVLQCLLNSSLTSLCDVSLTTCSIPADTVIETRHLTAYNAAPSSLSDT